MLHIARRTASTLLITSGFLNKIDFAAWQTTLGLIRVKLGREKDWGEYLKSPWIFVVATLVQVPKELMRCDKLDASILDTSIMKMNIIIIQHYNAMHCSANNLN